MIFFAKRTHTNEYSSNRQECLFIVGLFLAIGLIGGLATLIYGKTNICLFINLFVLFRFNKRSFVSNNCWCNCVRHFGIFNCYIYSCGRTLSY